MFPRVVHHVCFVGCEELAGWRKFHPTYRHEVWNLARIQTLLEGHFAWFSPVWKLLPTAEQRTATAYAMILLQHGGVAAAGPCTANFEATLAHYDLTDKSVLLRAAASPLTRIRLQNLNPFRVPVDGTVLIAKKASPVLHKYLLKTFERFKRDLRYSSAKERIAQEGGPGLLSNVVAYDEHAGEIEILGRGGEPQGLLLAGLALLCLLAALRHAPFAGRLLAMAVLTYLNLVLSTSVHQAFVGDRNVCQGPLPDRGLDLVPAMRSRRVVALVWQTPGYLCMGTLIFAFAKDFRLGSVFALTLMLFFNLRQICMQLTGLPSPEELKVSQDVAFWHAFSDSFRRSAIDRCPGETDLIFSGHTGTTALCLLFLMLHLRRVDSLLWRAGFAGVMVGVAALILSVRLHYTVDIALAVIISVLLFLQARRLYESGAPVDGSSFSKAAVLCLVLSLAVSVANVAIQKQMPLNV